MLVEISEARRMIARELRKEARQTWGTLPSYVRNDFAGPVAGGKQSVTEAIEQFNLWRSSGST